MSDVTQGVAARRPLPATPVVGVIGATGAAGGTLLTLLGERSFPFLRLHLMASERSIGRQLRVGPNTYAVEALSDAALGDCDILFLAAGGEVARHATSRMKAGAVAIDKSSAFRADPTIPLVVPEVNGWALEGDDAIIAAPNCIAIPLSLVLAPLDAVFGVTRVSVATYQSASGAGTRLLEELTLQGQAVARGDTPVATVYPHILFDNVVPGGWKVDQDGVMEEEAKIRDETRRVMGRLDLDISVTCVRVPVSVGHAMAVFIDGNTSMTKESARAVLEAAKGVTVVDDPSSNLYPMPHTARGGNTALVGRLHETSTQGGRLSLFVSADNLRKGAALNAVQIAEHLMTPKEAMT